MFRPWSAWEYPPLSRMMPARPLTPKSSKTPTDNDSATNLPRTPGDLWMRHVERDVALGSPTPRCRRALLLEKASRRWRGGEGTFRVAASAAHKAAVSLGRPSPSTISLPPNGASAHNSSQGRHKECRPLRRFAPECWALRATRGIVKVAADQRKASPDCINDISAIRRALGNSCLCGADRLDGHECAEGCTARFRTPPEAKTRGR